ncbi:hypothetical protein A2U01_0087037, partial [Trifolium medium]|nr:hypothetical protein [Trifolium medium]
IGMYTGTNPPSVDRPLAQRFNRLLDDGFLSINLF